MAVILTLIIVGSIYFLWEDLNNENTFFMPRFLYYAVVLVLLISMTEKIVNLEEESKNNCSQYEVVQETLYKIK